MPYIDEKSRKKLTIGHKGAKNASELNYLITKLIISYVKNKPLTYQVINDVKGACQGALAEFDRRVTNIYEEEKILQNGDIYDSLKKT